MSQDGPITDDFVFIPGYLVTKQLAANSQCRVYEGIDRKDLKTTVAIEVARSNDEETQAWYRRRENTLGHLEHPGIPGLVHGGLVDGYPYLVFSWLPLTNLTQSLRGCLDETPEKVLAILRDVADVLDYAHQHEICHGGLHASHIGFSPEGRLGVTGFGEYPPLQNVGSLAHWAPEQLGSNPGDATPSGDLYAFAELAFFLLCGTYPFQTASEKLPRRVSGQLTAPAPLPTVLLRDHRPELPPVVSLVIGRGMSTDPKLRPQSARDFVWSLTTALDHTTRAQELADPQHWRAEFAQLLSVVIDPQSDATQVAAAMEKVADHGFIDFEDYAPLLDNLPRLVQFLTIPNDRVQEKAVEIAAALGDPCAHAIWEHLAGQRFLFGSEELRYAFTALLACGGAESIASVLTVHADPVVRRMAALVLRDAGSVPHVGEALRQASTDPDSAIQSTAKESYASWLENARLSGR